MTEFDPVEFGRSIGAMIREAVEPLKSENAELRKEIDALKAREPVKGEKGDPGKDADPEAVVAEAVKRLLDEERLETVVSLCAAKAVHEYLSEHPIPVPKDGERGPQGEKGEPGKSVTLDDVSVFLEAAVAKHVLDFERRANEKLDKAI